MDDAFDKILSTGGVITGVGVAVLGAVIPDWVTGCKIALDGLWQGSNFYGPPGFSRGSCLALVDMAAGGVSNLVWGIAFTLIGLSVVYYVTRSVVADRREAKNLSSPPV